MAGSVGLPGKRGVGTAFAAKELNLPHYLIVESETENERAERRAHAGKSSAESYAATLRQMEPDCRVDIVSPAEAGDLPGTERLGSYDAVFLSGSPLHVYEDRPEVRRHLDFMRAVFASGTPGFGSCAGLQVATAAAGGRVARMARRMEAGVARRIVATAAGASHPLLAGRPATWDAPAIHGDEVAELPPGAVHLATNGATSIQAAEIRHGAGVFWGVQYHPELAPGEIGAALRRQDAELVEEGLARSCADVEGRVVWFDALQDDAGDGAARWHLGIDDEFAVEDRRRRELRNFIDAAPRLKGRRG
jgi:GMP synthase-like glutamine amidotransferase